MSKWRDIAQEVKAEGEARRGNFSPEPGSWPDRSYRYWRDAQFDPPKRENFCHFWRVAVLWSPMLRFRRWWNRHEDVITITFFSLLGAVIFGLIGWGIVSEQNTGEILAFIGIGVVGFLYVLAGIGGGVMMGDPDADIGFSERALFIATLPISVPVYGLARFFNGAPGKWMNKHGLQILMGMAMLGVSLALGSLCYGIISSKGLAGVFIVGLIGAVLFSAAWVIRNAGDWVAGWRARQDRIEEERLEKLYAEWGTISPDLPAAEPKERTWVGKKMRAAGDLLILVGQVVRVNKWKICPYVTIIDDTTETA